MLNVVGKLLYLDNYRFIYAIIKLIPFNVMLCIRNICEV